MATRRHGCFRVRRRVRKDMRRSGGESAAAAPISFLGALAWIVGTLWAEIVAAFLIWYYLW